MHSGASVNAVTKSGTNRFHGDLFEFVRNHRFNATDPFARDRQRRARRRRSEAAISSAARSAARSSTDRMFFFGAYQGTWLREQPSDVFAFIPTAQMLAGDFTTFASPQCNATGNVTLRAPFVGNRVDPALFSPAALRIVEASGDRRPIRAVA